MPPESLSRPTLISLLLVLGISPAWSITDAPAEVSTPENAETSEVPGLPPGEQAKVAYNHGLQLLMQADAAPAEKARPIYLQARKHLEEATRLAPEMAEAWNATGYVQRKLGYYEQALAAYNLALTLKPGYPEAIEYRGEAYLALNRLDEAKQAYLQLFASHRAVSEELLKAMKSWVAARRKDPAGFDPATIDQMAKWVEERSQIAAQTAALTREGASAGWR
ncbi:MAG TPA: tetratricopeptide repeat protein [Steroidobacteraceae bacterium]